VCAEPHLLFYESVGLFGCAAELEFHFASGLFEGCAGHPVGEVADYFGVRMGVGHVMCGCVCETYGKA
jgi:hypothetical protein